MVVKKINYDLCFGCKLCVDVCTEDVLRFDEVKRKPYIKYAKDCIACLFCEAFCPVGAVECDYTKPRKLVEAI